MDGILYRALARRAALAAIRARTVAIMAAVAGVFLVAGTPPVSADENHVDGELKHEEVDRPTGAFAATNIWKIARGGQLYDKWYAVLDLDPPEGTHPAYPGVGQKSGATTFRCKECHGWDYRGADGTYASGSHFTGIKGVRGVVGTDAEVIEAILRDDTHALKDILPRRSIEYLALFLSEGQLDMDLFIDRTTKKAKGDARRGAAFYQTICAVCHGFDGTDINFHDPDDPEYVGTVAHKNPWEALHKIRYGQPGVGMVAMTVLGVQDQIDILAFIQTLPTE